MVVVTDENKDLIPQERVENLESDFDAVNQTASNNFNTLDNKINTNVNTINNKITSNVNTLNTKIDTNVNTINKTISDLESYMEEKLNNVFPLFYTTWSDHILNQSCWLRADTFSAHSGNTYSTAYNHLVNDLKTATKKTTVREWKSNNVTLNGEIDVQKNIITRFYGNTNYITHNAPNPTTSMDYVVKWHTPASYSNYDVISSTIQYDGIIWRLGTSGQSTIWASTNGTSWNLASSWNANLTIPYNTDVWFRITWDGATYKFGISIDNVTWQWGNTLASTAGLAFGGVHNIGGCSWESYPFINGICDLTGCYLNVNGSRVWTGCNYYSQLTYYDSTDGHKIVLNDQESVLNELYNRKGVAWYYVLNQTNKTFKLPRTKYGFVGVRDSGGTFVDESLPNVKGTFYNTNIVQYQNGNESGHNKTTGAFTAEKNNTGTSGGAWNNDKGGIYKLDASRVSDAYKDNASVQQKSTQMYLYFYIGYLNVEINESTISSLLESINSKLDKTDLVETPAILVETYRNGNNWYRLYSDGFIEQGGIYDYGSLVKDWAAVSITYPKPFLNTVYTLTTQAARNDGASGSINNQSFVIKFTNTYFTSEVYGDGTSQYLWWEAKGYIS